MLENLRGGTVTPPKLYATHLNSEKEHSCLGFSDSHLIHLGMKAD